MTLPACVLVSILSPVYHLYPVYLRTFENLLLYTIRTFLLVHLHTPTCSSKARVGARRYIGVRGADAAVRRMGTSGDLQERILSMGLGGGGCDWVKGRADVVVRLPGREWRFGSARRFGRITIDPVVGNPNYTIATRRKIATILQVPNIKYVSLDSEEVKGQIVPNHAKASGTIIR